MRSILLAFVILIVSFQSFGQCAGSNELWNQVIGIRDDTILSNEEKLNQLLKYETGLAKCGSRQDSAWALIYQRIAASYFFLQDFSKAAHYMRSAIRLINDNSSNPAINPRHNIRNYYSLAWIYDSLGFSSAKMHAYDSCIMLALRYQIVDIYLVKAMEYQTVYYFNIGDYYQCIRQANLCEQYSREYVGKVSEDEKHDALGIAIRAFLWKVNALLILKDFETLERLTKAKIQEKEIRNFPEHMVTLYSQLAELYVHKNDPKAAIFYYEKGLQYAGSIKFDMASKSILNNIGYNIYYSILKENEKALKFCLKALRFPNRDELEKTNEIFETVNILSNIANIYAYHGDFDSAFYYYREGLKKVTPDGNETSLLKITDDTFLKQRKIRYVISLLTDKGSTCLEQYKSTNNDQYLQQAIEVFRTADILLNRIRLAQIEVTSKLFWREDSRRLYDRAIEACYFKRNVADAFYFFERSRAILLADQLMERDLAMEEELLQLSRLQKTILQMETSGRYATGSSIFMAKQELEHLQETVKRKRPLFFQTYLDSNSLTLAKARQHLLKDSRDNLLEIFWGDSAIYFLWVNSTEAKISKADKQRYDHLAEKYIRYLSNPDLLNRNFSDFCTTANTLYQLIFHDIPLTKGRWLISSDGPNFPFESLVIHPRPLTYFLEQHIVSYIHSASVIIFQSGHRQQDNIRFLGVAPVSYREELKLPDLPGSEESLLMIGSLFPQQKIYVKDEADRDLFLRQFGKYSVIQLYTHAADSSSRNEPVIYFADSMLYLSELIGESKPLTQLVVLSACETGAGRLFRGEGIFSFNRGFAALGVPCSVTNLWMIDNQSTYEITQLFYKYLREGKPVDEALQLAKLTFIQQSSKESQLPYYWAATIAAGNAQLTFEKKHPRLNYILLAGGIIAVLLVLILSLQKKMI